MKESKMKILDIKQFDLSSHGLPDKLVILATYKKKFFVWIENEDILIYDHEVREKANQFKSKAAAVDCFDFYFDILLNCGDADLDQSSIIISA